MALAASVGIQAAAGPDGGTGADWPHWRGPADDGMSTETAWTSDWGREGPPLLWGKEIGVGYSAVSVADGKAYTMGNVRGQDVVYCFDAVKGTELWTHSYPCARVDHPGPRATPTIDGDRVYTLSQAGDLFCLTAGEGGKAKVVWSKNIVKDFGAKRGGWGFACSPVIDGDELLIDGGTVVVLDKATGDLKRKQDLGLAGYSTPAIFERGRGKLVACFVAEGLVVLKYDDLSVVAKYAWKTAYDVNAATPIILDGGKRIFISSGYKTGCAMLRLTDDGKLVRQWQNKNMSNHMNTCVLYKGFLYGFNGNAGGADLVCLNPADGEPKWSQGGLGAGAMIIAGDRMLILSEKGTLVAAKAASDGYHKLASVEVLGGICWTMPVLSHGLIYVRNDQGKLLCLDARRSSGK